tara:strand:+ start:208 stop:1713 length:1506 start_codon:yes stop_codon:yes gene_type:complete
MIVSYSPFMEKYSHQVDEKREKNKINKIVDNKRKTVAVQGLGFVGSAMVAALAEATDKNGNLLYNVIGVDLGNNKNYWKIARANKGKPPVVSSDKNMTKAYLNSKQNKNFYATYSNYAYAKADIVVIDLNIDIKKKSLGGADNYNFTYKTFEKAIKNVADNIYENTTVIVETTVPPGTTEKIIYPIFKDSFVNRGLDINKFYLAHAPERVMPGPNYLNSIVNYHRVFSGINSESKKRAKKFLTSFINVKKYPLIELHSTTASEMAKVLENSYRAANIAFIQEWTEYAEKAGVNLYDIVNAIRVRTTHANIMSPGFGVGGYCLTKDSLLADWSFKNLFNGKGHLEMSLNAININDLMPNYALKLLKQEYNDLNNINLGILGVSYLNDVNDTRYSPSEFFYDKCIKNKINVFLHDPIVKYWKEKNIIVNQDWSFFVNKKIDVVIFAVRHKEYINLDPIKFIKVFPDVKFIIDGFNIVSNKNAKIFKKNNIKIQGIGKAYWETN